MYEPRSRAVIFDCDGVLVDSEPLVNRLESDLVTQLGIPCTPEDASRRFKGKTVSGVAESLEAELGRPLSKDWIYDWGMATALGFVRELRAIEGVEAVVRALSERRVPIAVASQSPPARVELSLRLCKLDSYFGPHVYTASMVARPKPAPDLYLITADRLGVAPSECVVIEDSPTGVRAAVSAGMTCFGYAASEAESGLRAAGATKVFRAMPMLLDLLRSDGG
jgi:HAD superfamily hydrolase (TIGR01509 family)